MKFNKILTRLLLLVTPFISHAQINTDQVLNVGRNALYFEDYVVSIQYFNQVIAAKPYLAQPYFYRALAKYNLDDLRGAEADVSTAIGHNPFITDAYELRGVIYQNLGRNRDAIADYDRALSMLPENRSLLFNRAMALFEINDTTASHEAFDNLIRRHPHFDNAYLGRAQLLLSIADTTAAEADINKALSLNPNSINGHILRSEVNMKKGKGNFTEALADMNQAIKLNPKNAGYFINRAFLRYKLDDYFGAMSDYDYALQLDPDNFVAHYNRALLCAEVKDYDKALLDLNEVIRLKPDEYRTLYNRAIIYRDRREFKKALADIDRVIEAFPTLAAAYFLRFDIKHSLGDKTGKRDLDKSLALAKERIRVKGKNGAGDTSDLFGTPTVDDNIASVGDNNDTEPQEMVAARFSSLLTVTDNLQVDQEYNNRNIRGKVQDRKVSIEIEPLFTLTYFVSPTELRPSSDYIKEIAPINHTRALRFLLQATNHEPRMTDEEEIKKHFESIEYYNSYISTHSPRAIDFFGRGMDQMMVRNFEAAEADFRKAAELSNSFELALFMEAVAQYRIYEASKNTADGSHNTPELQRAQISKIINIIDRVIELSPMMSTAYYNKGTLLLEADDLTSGIAALTHAVELKPDFGEAYYNRGYAYLRLGNKTAGLADLSKAGELGIVPSYNLLKRMSTRF